uniref:Uncharacterized protein n=1 Tax=Pan troglodytes TaxID=9598 RepID=A0A2I3RJ39_PANTR
MQWIDQNVKTDISKVGYYVKLKLHKLCRKICSKMSLGISFLFLFFSFFFFALYYLVCKYLD